MGKKKKAIPIPRVEGNVGFIDTHCHLDMYKGEDPGQIVAQAREYGVNTIITVGINLPSSKKAIEIAELHADVFATIGVHPHNVKELTDQQYAQLREYAKHPKVVAYGEIGLDYVKDYSPIPQQLEHCRAQVRLGKELGLPLIIHDREAHDDILAILREEGPFPAGGVMHCFSGDRHFALDVLELGFYISIPGVVTFNKAEALQDAVDAVPLSALLLETDGPFLAPVPKRGKTNYPHYVPYTAQKVADIKMVSLDELARQTTENARKLFQLPLV